MWCKACAKNVWPNDFHGKICCTFCGRVLDEDNFSNEPTFVKNAAGQSQLSGNYVSSIQSDCSLSRGRILDEASYGINSMIHALNIIGGESVVKPALALYKIALERNFTRGRRKELVEAACLYIACRENKKPYLLIDFSELLRINVYVLGAVFLQLCKLLSLGEHPVVQKPVDPSLFIHRFTNRLFGENKPLVSRTALQIVASMKRDWIQTGRKPSGLCGAALYISALSHGLSCSKLDIIKVVHVCEATLTKRLIEFENTESGGLTIEEFNMKAEELEKEERFTKSPCLASNASAASELLCEHKGSETPPFALGLCESCYSEFIKLSGGLDGGSEPPAFQRAEQERIMAKEAAADNTENPDCILSNPMEKHSKFFNFNKEGYFKSTSEGENLQPLESESIGVASRHKVIHDSAYDKLHGVDMVGEELESLSDIDDSEVDGYLHSEEETRFKKIIWEEMNKEYLEEQAAKEAAVEAAKKAFEANLHNCPEDVQAAQKLAAAAAAAVAKSKKERQQKRAAEIKNSGPAQTAAEATRQMLTRKRLSSKINYDILDKLFDESAISEDPKKSRTEPNSFKVDEPLKHRESDLEHEDTYEEQESAVAHNQDNYYENEAYNYDDEYEYDGF